jgi:hypothetical protein
MMAKRFDPRLSAFVLATLAVNGAGIVALRQAFEALESTAPASAVMATGNEVIVSDAAREERQPRAYPETMARPLFIRGRAPFVPPPPVTIVPPMPAPPMPPPMAPPGPAADIDVKVYGVLAEGRGARALLSSTSKPDGDWLRIGEMIGGWTLVEISSEGVVLSAGPQRRTVLLYP